MNRLVYWGIKLGPLILAGGLAIYSGITSTFPLLVVGFISAFFGAWLADEYKEGR